MRDLPADERVSVLEGRLLAFVRRDLLGTRPVTIEPETYLFDVGLIDSLKILRLIAFLEIQIGREIPDEDVVMKHFRTVRAMARHFGGT